MPHKPAPVGNATPHPRITFRGDIRPLTKERRRVSNTVSRKDVGFRSERGPILIAFMLTTGLVAIDSTILATAVSSIVDDLGSFSLFPWLFPNYLLAQAVSVPIYA